MSRFPNSGRPQNTLYINSRVAKERHLMIDPNYFSLLRMKLAATLYDASSCEAWPWCTASECCEAVYHYLEHLGVELTREHPGSAAYVYSDFEPYEVAGVLEAIFKMAELGNLHQGDVLRDIEVIREMADLLGRNEGAWLSKLAKIGDASHHTWRQRETVVQFVYELLEIALPDSYLAQEPIPHDSFDEDSEDHFTSDSSFDDHESEVFQDPSALNVEERIVLIDELWVPEWSAQLPKSSRRVIGLILAAIDGRPYATPFASNINPRVGTVVIWPIEIVKAFGVTEAEAKVAIDGAMRSISHMAPLYGDSTSPFSSDT